MAIHLGNESAVRRQSWVDRPHDADADVAASAEHADAHTGFAAASPDALLRLLAPSPRDPNARRARAGGDAEGAARDLPPLHKPGREPVWHGRGPRSVAAEPTVTRLPVPAAPADRRSTIPERAPPAARLSVREPVRASVPEAVRIAIAAPPTPQPDQARWIHHFGHSLQARTERAHHQAELRHAALAASPTLQGGGWLRNLSQFSHRLHGLIARLQTPVPALRAAARDAVALDGVTRAVHQRFAAQAGNKEAFTALLHQAFGDKFDAAKAETIRQQALAGDFSWAPKVEVVSSQALADLSGTQGPGSAQGAYVQSSDTIYISRELLHGDPAQAQRLLMEEMGHGLDARINTSDAAGDEGEIFSKLMHGDAISAPEMAALKADNDHGVVNIGGQAVTVEYGWLSKAFKAVTGGIKKVAGAVTKGVVNLAKSTVKVATGLVTMDFDKVKEGFKDGVNAVKTSVKAVHQAIKDTAKEIHRITKQAFQKLMQSKLFAAVLMVCRFIPIPIVQLVVHIVDAVRAAYMVYQGIKHKSLSAVLGGVASLVGGAGNVAGALGASASTVGTISSVANAASKLSMAYNAVANKDIGAAMGLLGGVSGVQGTALGTAAGYVQQGLGIRQAVRSGDTAAALGGAFGLAQSVRQQFEAGVAQQRPQQPQQREAEAADNRGLLNAADRDLRGMPAEQDGGPNPAALPAADEPRNGGDVDTDNVAARNRSVAPARAQTSLTVGKGQTLEGIARAQYGENWRAGVAQMAIDNGIKLNQWGSPILGVGNTLELPDLSGKSDQELASLARTGGRIIANNDQGLQAKADLEERGRIAADEKVKEAAPLPAGNETAAGGACTANNPQGLSDSQLKAQALAQLGRPPSVVDSLRPATGAVGSAEWFRTASEAELHRNGYQTAKAWDGQNNDPYENTRRNMEMAIVLPPLIAATSLATGGVASSFASRWLGAQIALQPATQIGTTEIVKGMAISGGVSTGTYLLFQQENATPAGVAVAFGAGAVGGGVVKQSLNFAAALPNTAVPFTYANALTQATGTAFGFGTVGWMNGPPGLSGYGAVSNTGDSWWTRPIYAPQPKP